MADLSELESKIIKQVEYYFGDSNLSRDRFLQVKIKENDGWIDMDTMLNFKRLRALSDSHEVILQALKKSKSDLVEVGTKSIRRNPKKVLVKSSAEINEIYRAQTVYVKGFSQDETLDDIISYLEKYGGETVSVQLRRFPKDKVFKGSVFASFKNKEDAQKFLDSADSANYKDQAMLRKWISDYFEDKRKEIHAKNAEKRSKSDNRILLSMVPNSLLEVSGLPKSESAEVDSVNSGDHNEDTKAEVEENSDAAKPSEKVVAGAKRKADHLDSRPCRTVLNLKIWLAEHLGPELPINWIDAIPSESRAIIRMKSPRGASGAYDKLKKVFGDKPMIYDGCELSFRILEGDEEKEKWKKILDVQNRKGRRRHQKLPRQST